MTHLTALLCTISILKCFVLYEGSKLMRHSTCGRTKVLYGSSFTASILVFTFLLTKPRVLLALAVISLMWWFKLRSWDMLTPRYFALSTDYKNWPWRVYWDWSGFLDRAIWSTWHLLGLNSISQIRSHSCKVYRSTWRVFASSDEVTVKKTDVSSRTTLPVTVSFVAHR